MSIFDRVEQLEQQLANDRTVLVIIATVAVTGLVVLALVGIWLNQVARCNNSNAAAINDHADRIEALSNEIGLLSDLAVKYAGNTVQRPRPTPGPRTQPAAAVTEQWAHQLADTAPVVPVREPGRHRKERT